MCISHRKPKKRKNLRGVTSTFFFPAQKKGERESADASEEMESSSE